MNHIFDFTDNIALAVHWLGESLADYLCLAFSHINLVLCVSLGALFKFIHVPSPVERCLEEFPCTLRISSFWIQLQ